MAYTPIPDQELEPGKPGSSELFFKLRDNPEGIAAGSPGAPKIRLAAFDLAFQTVVSQTIAAGASVILPAGFITGMLSGTSMRLQVQHGGGTWVSVFDGSAQADTTVPFSIFSDGVRARITNGGGTLASYKYLVNMLP